jgi:transitional endoplasmic reticulum ATPase
MKESTLAITQKTIKRDQERTLEVLAELAEKRASHETIATYDGEQVQIPEKMNLATAYKLIGESIEANEQVMEFNRTFRYRPWDGAAAFERALYRASGTTGSQRAIMTMFGPIPPTRHTIDISTDETIDVPWGRISMALFEGEVFLGSEDHSEFGPIFALTISAPRRHAQGIEGFFNLIQLELEENSIYRGKAFTASAQPEFLDLSKVNPDMVIHSDATLAQLRTSLWAPLEYTDEFRRSGLPLKRTQLFIGKYGTGKTLTGNQTAAKAVEHGWSFILCRPGQDSLAMAIQSAMLYGPALVHVEDVDNLIDTTDTENGDKVSKVLDTFDGMVSKGEEMMLTLTTNHVENIHKGMLRPGRIDSIIEFGALDRNGVMRMIEAVVPTDERVEGLDYDRIYEAMEGYVPAFVREVIDRTRMYALARTGKVGSPLTTDDFVRSGEGLRPQLALMEQASEGERRPPLDELLAQLTETKMTDVLNRSVVKDHALPIRVNEGNGG